MMKSTLDFLILKKKNRREKLRDTYLLQKQLTSTSLVQFKFALVSARQLVTVKKREKKKVSQPNIKKKKRNKRAYRKLKYHSNSETVLN